MSAIQLVTVFVENRPGQTAQITKILAAADINIRWVTIANSGNFGVMKFLVNDSLRAHRVLRQEGLMVSFLDVLAVEVQDIPGSLHHVADILAQNRINLDNASGFVANQRAVLIIETHELSRAGALLEKEGIPILSQEEWLNL